MLTKELFSSLVYIWIGIGIATFILLLKVTAPYGRHSSTQWGPMINNKLGWFIMELPALLIPLLFVIMSGDLTNILVSVASFLWFSHYFHRVIIFPLRLQTGKKKMPLVIVVFAIFFNFVNGSINGYWLANFAPDISFDWPVNLRIILGTAVFISGYVINQYHDKVLLGLRKNDVKGYQIPYGGLFKFVSCPNFLGEIIEWSGFALVVWSLPGLAFFVWTFVNLVPRALDHHKWYKSHFNDYPPERKAVFPYLL